ncbi:MAG: type II toxin-antitoxin system RelE/ParE family toxin [Bacteroidetes bacterium]|nr:type II toxin-antitoxin system RelE/ParE family toxin [Bacteroidota bacterium]
MRKRVLITKEAEEDLTDSYAWYNLQKNNLGEDFITAIENGFSQIETNPFTFQLVTKTTRRAVTKRFPFSIYYRMDADNTITVLAVLHQFRNQKIILRR